VGRVGDLVGIDPDEAGPHPGQEARKVGGLECGLVAEMLAQHG